MNYNNDDTEFLIDLRLNMEREIMTLTNIVNEKKKQLIYITKLVDKNCNHEWTKDNIDLLPETNEGTPIKYCKNCWLTYDTR